MPTARRIATADEQRQDGEQPAGPDVAGLEGGQHDVVGRPAEHPGVGDGQRPEQHAAQRGEREDPGLAPDRDAQHGEAVAQRPPLPGSSGCRVAVLTGSTLRSTYDTSRADRAQRPVRHRPAASVRTSRPCAASGRSRTSSCTWCCARAAPPRSASLSRRWPGDRRASRRIGRRTSRCWWSRLRSGPPLLSPYALPPLDRLLNTLEYFVHHEDIRRAQPDWTPRDLGDDAERLMWSMLRTAGKAADPPVARSGCASRTASPGRRPCCTATRSP